MKPTKGQAINFINNELKKLAKARGAKILPAQAQVKVADIAKVKIKNATSRRPQ
ncbi:hypothetical protein KDA23_06755 [Candidatus Saccharibacteria bacterium]|nr:hypothetical protein [Candidatus Saccharibacteria bacterium]